MILVDEIKIEEFRGIRNLTLPLKGKNFAVCGLNGTGKSGVVDALEFGLTGNVSRLSGEGTSDISLKKHGPHVDSCNTPEKAKVTLTLTIPQLQNKKVTLERNLGNPKSAKIHPATPEVLEILKKLDNRPEFVLSRRELIAYVLARPGKRSEEVQALLRLNKIEELRKTFTKIKNSLKKESETLEQVKESARDQLAKSLEISSLTTEKIIEAVNSRRLVLELDPLNEITSTTSFNDGLDSKNENSNKFRLNKKDALDNIEEAINFLDALREEKFLEECESLQDKLKKLDSTPLASDSVPREKFLQTAISMITEEAICPVCDTKWDIKKLNKLLQEKLKFFKEATEAREDIEKNLLPIIKLLDNFYDLLTNLEKYSSIITPENTEELTKYKESLLKKTQDLKNLVPFSETITSLKNINNLPKKLLNTIEIIKRMVSELPDPSKKEAARDYLVLCQSKLENSREAARNFRKAQEKAFLAEISTKIYTEETNKVLETTYKQVESTFSSFYRLINSEDEDEFTAKLTPSIGKLGFGVDFYGRGHFPPGAYHSEGHQDGMGLCLYLALMKKLQGDNFRFAVLDDVLMSVDVGHRREVCNLLKEKFPDTQFILTTHDQVWLKHMESSGLIKGDQVIRFCNWTPDKGPEEWDGRDVWAEIKDDLKKDDIRSAASTLRYYLEYIFGEVCDKLKVPVVFRGDGRYELGDLLVPAVKHYEKLLEDGIKAAQSWGDDEKVEFIKNQQKILKKSFVDSQSEQWQINPAVHFNELANLAPSDFRKVLESFENLVKIFFCQEEDCKGLLYLTFPQSRNPDSLRCLCGKTMTNLEKKK